MSPELAGIIGIAIVIALLFARMWIGAAMAIVGFVGYAYIMGIKPAFAVVAQIPFTTISWYPLTTVPMYIFMGIVLFQSAIGADLYEAAYKWVGQLRGGLAIATVYACAAFASITGISAPALISMAKSALPAMRKYKYDEELSLGSIACAGTLAFLIPPSMSFIIYGIITENSIAALYMAGFLPGILLACLMAATIVIITARRPAAGPAGPKTRFIEKIVSLKLVWPTLFLFILVLGGIYAGIFTPTEGGAVGAFGAMVIGFAMRRLTLRKLVDSLLEAAYTSAMIFLLIIGAYILMKFLAVSQLPALLGETIGHLAVSRMVIFTGIVILYILLGMFLDIISAVILTIPVIYPLIIMLGFDPIWFGVIITILIEMGLVTPPVGLDAFILSGATNVPLATIFRGIVPFVVAEIVCVIILAAFPQIALFLPGTMR